MANRPGRAASTSRKSLPSNDVENLTSPRLPKSPTFMPFPHFLLVVGPVFVSLPSPPPARPRMPAAMPSRPRSDLRLERLESRDVPATLVSPTTVTYQDADGDHVRVTLSKPLLTPDTVNGAFQFDVG